MRTVSDLLNLRWRAAQLMLAHRDGDTRQAAVLVVVLRVEEVDLGDVAAEWELLTHQYGHRSRWYLAAEVDRLARKVCAVPS